MPTAESYGFLSTFPPTQCGLASFSASLMAALAAGDDRPEVGVVRVAERAGSPASPLVVGELLTTDTAGEAAAAEALNRFSVAVVQHEYGIYGGHDGESVIEVIRRLRVPSVVVLHTVLSEPTAHQRTVLEHVARAASAVVVMTETARARLLAGYLVDAGKVTVIAHGAPTEWVRAGPAPARGASALLTWGLLGPGKGIEWVIDALATLRDIEPLVQYTVAGETHPNVVERQGESYREMLQARADRLGVGHMLRFDNRYLDQATLGALVRDADVVVLPYDSTDQVTSGVLIEAVSARRPVVATGFSHAVELLSGGAGTIVGHRDPAAISAAVRHILTGPGVAASMRAAAEGLTSDLAWTAVAERYRDLSARLQEAAAAVPA
ncbi:glycosyltransferase [Acidiferrimicrobium sp. IK]|uniref:glycosyltransferase n=1 Tax=Acidiferrimicrobium sp. IK TaxID=2871700 RepID=UPI0021CB6811|nr:glycosyltransferase [Acidiferrimicrobium sp. IK]MCU4182814.1 glycosyltransferase [Acidiferrimicrobium sp. IK]